MENMNKTTFENLLKRLYKWRKSIVIGTGIAFILTCIVALLLPVYYKAQTSFYAASQDLASPESIFGLSQTKTEYFGTNQDEDRIKAIARSRDMMEFLIDSFQLFDYYDIDPHGDRANYAMANKLKKRYKINQSENDAIHISFLDKSPELTAAIANAATEKLKALGINEIKASQYNMMEGYQRFINEKSSDLAVLQDSLSRLKKVYNIIEPSTQAKSLATTFAKAQTKLVEYQSRLNSYQQNFQRDSVRKYTSLVEGLSKTIEVMESDTVDSGANIAYFSEGSQKINNIQEEIRGLLKSQNEVRDKLNYLRSVYESNTSSIHVIEIAEVPEVKYWPRRMLMVVGVTVLVFVLLCFYVLVKEGYGSIDWKEISHGGS